MVWEDVNKGFGLEVAIKDFEKEHDDIKVSVKEVSSILQEDKLIEAIENSLESPDILVLLQDRAKLVYDRGLLTPIKFMQVDILPLLKQGDSYRPI